MAAAFRHWGQQMAPFPQVSPEPRGGAIHWRFFVVLEAKENELRRWNTSVADLS